MEYDLTGDDDSVPVNVAVRICPPPTQQYHNVGVQVNAATNELFLGPDTRFLFDCVYGASTSQHEVFISSVQPLLTPLLDGYNVTVILYGAANTGKTHTLVGPGPCLLPVIEEESFGLIPRSVRTLFQVASQLVGSQCVIDVEFVEIYNEEIRDLLSDNLSSVYLEPDSCTGQLKMTNVTSVRCLDTSEVLSYLDMGLALHHQCRNIATLSDTTSHTVFTLKVSQRTMNPSGVPVLKQSKLQFVDLAPSDRMTTIGSTNLGLLALGNVVSALGDPRRNVSCVPYHDNILTQVLASALGGNCVTCIITCVSPLLADQEETLNTLMWASRAGNIVNIPQPFIISQEPSLIMSPNPNHQNYQNSSNIHCFQNTNNNQFNESPIHQRFHNTSNNQLSTNYLQFQDRRDSDLSLLSPGSMHGHGHGPGLGYSPVKTPLSSTSPLSYKSNAAPLQLYLANNVNHDSIQPETNTILLGNQGHLISELGPGHNLSVPRPASHNLIQDGIVDNEEMFKLQFAASQYKALVSSAGELLSAISLSKNFELGDKKQIESWICKKEESENAIKKSGNAEKALDKIVEESEDDSEAVKTETSDASDNVSEDSESKTDVDSDYSQEDEDLDERFHFFHEKFRNKTNSLIENAEASYFELLTTKVELKKEVTGEKGQKDFSGEIIQINNDLKSTHQAILNISSKQNFNNNQDLAEYLSQINDLQQRVKNLEQIFLSQTQETKSISHLQQSLMDLKLEHEKLRVKLGDEENIKKELESQVSKNKLIISSLEQKIVHQEQMLKESLETSKEINAKQKWLRQEEERIQLLEQSLHEKQRSIIESSIKETSFINHGSELNELELLTSNTTNIRLEVEDLRKIRKIFIDERQNLDDKLNENQGLTSKEERHLVELDESVEAIDSAIEYKNEIICNKNQSYNKYDGDDILMKKLVKLPVQETRSLLHKFFLRVIDLRLEGKKMEIHLEEVEEQYNDLGKYARDLGRSLQRSKLDAERRLAAQHKEYQAKINALAQQLADKNLEKHNLDYGKKLKSLEKELQLYKNYYKENKRTASSSKPSINHAYVKTEEVMTDVEGGYESSRPSSVVSRIQPSHIEIFQKRLAKIQKKMGDTAKPTVTREQRKIIIEQPVSASNSVEKVSRRKR